MKHCSVCSPAIDSLSSGRFHSDRPGTGRKLAIRILELFDHRGFTQRKSNEH
ncbi:SelB domain-containing protein [Pseudomonas cerasi]